MRDDGRLLVLGVLGAVGVVAAARGSRGLVRRGDAGALSWKPPEGRRFEWRSLRLTEDSPRDETLTLVQLGWTQAGDPGPGERDPVYDSMSFWASLRAAVWLAIHGAGQGNPSAPHLGLQPFRHAVSSGRKVFKMAGGLVLVPLPYSSAHPPMVLTAPAVIMAPDEDPDLALLDALGVLDGAPKGLEVSADYDYFNRVIEVIGRLAPVRPRGSSGVLRRTVDEAQRKVERIVKAWQEGEETVDAFQVGDICHGGMQAAVLAGYRADAHGQARDPGYHAFIQGYLLALDRRAARDGRLIVDGVSNKIIGFEKP